MATSTARIEAEVQIRVQLHGVRLAAALYQLAALLYSRWPRAAVALINFATHWLLYARVERQGGLFRVGKDIHMHYHEREAGRW